MDIERLKELNGIVALHVWLSGKAKKDLTALIDEAIARQSVTSEEVAEAIEYFEDTLQFISGEPQEKDHRLAITALQQYQPWIPVSERLPDKQGYYLCWFDDGFHGIYESGDRTSTELWCDVTHWMPLPEPPKGE